MPSPTAALGHRKRRLTGTAFRHRRRPRAARPSRPKAATVRAHGPWSGPRPCARARRSATPRARPRSASPSLPGSPRSPSGELHHPSRQIGRSSCRGRSAGSPARCCWYPARPCRHRGTYAALNEQDFLARVFGDCRFGDPIDREIGDLVGSSGPLARGDKLFTYLRYDAELSATGLAALGCGDLVPERVRRLDAVDAMPGPYTYCPATPTPHRSRYTRHPPSLEDPPSPRW